MRKNLHNVGLYIIAGTLAGAVVHRRAAVADIAGYVVKEVAHAGCAHHEHHP